MDQYDFVCVWKSSRSSSDLQEILYADSELSFLLGGDGDE